MSRCVLPTLNRRSRLELIEKIFIGAVDKELTDKGYISPGLGDAVRFSLVRGHRGSLMISGRPIVQHAQVRRTVSCWMRFSAYDMRGANMFSIPSRMIRRTFWSTWTHA